MNKKIVYDFIILCKHLLPFFLNFYFKNHSFLRDKLLHKLSQIKLKIHFFTLFFYYLKCFGFRSSVGLSKTSLK